MTLTNYCFNAKVRCANGQTGYGRKKREVINGNADPNRIYEVSMSTVVKVANELIENKPQLWVDKGIFFKFEFF